MGTKIKNRNVFGHGPVSKPTAIAPGAAANGHETCQPAAEPVRPQPQQSSSTAKPAAEVETPPAAAPRTSPRAEYRKEIINAEKAVINFLRELGQPMLAAEVASLVQKVSETRFSVAVVGEFSRGKSTMINKMLGEDILPVGTLPTSALLTRIIYGPRQMYVIGKDGKIEKKLPLESKSWAGLTADNFEENEPEGRVTITYPSTWLKNNGIAIYDAPGAGDTEAKRAKIISATLNGADAAVVAISATSPLSQTEISFIKQRIVATRIPYVAVAVTMLDSVSLKERDALVNHIIKRLKRAGLDVPVFIASDTVELQSDTHKKRYGFDALRRQIEIWRNDPSRATLTEQWLLTNTLRNLDIASSVIAGGMAIANAKESERHDIISKRAEAVEQQRERWKAIEHELNMRAEIAVEKFNKRLKEIADSIVEKLCYEVGHVASPREWVLNDYAYRVKIELAAASMSADRMVAKWAATDLQWVNLQLHKEFRTLVQMQGLEIESKDNFEARVRPDASKLSDLKKARIKTQFLITGASIGAAMACAATGGLALIGTMGVGTGANIMAGRIFGRKVEEQRAEVKRLIAAEMPRIIEDATADTEGRIRILYDDILRETRRTERNWVDAQLRQIEAATPKEAENMRKKLETSSRKLTDLREQLNSLL